MMNEKENKLIEQASKELGVPIKEILLSYVGNGEREIFRRKSLLLQECRFKGPGESPIKECHDIVCLDSHIEARYAFWENENILVRNTFFSTTDRAPFWYTKNARIEKCHMNSPKSFRECNDISIKDSRLKGTESFWQVRSFDIDGFLFQSYYPFLECSHGKIKNLKMVGKYSFQHCHNITIEDSELDTKDAFWHSHDITVKNSHLKGEYIGWYAEDLTFINCTFEGTQPFVCSKNLTFIDCSFLKGTDRAFERTTAKGTLRCLPYSIYNPRNIDFQTNDTCPIDIDHPKFCHYNIHR